MMLSIAVAIVHEPYGYSYSFEFCDVPLRFKRGIRVTRYELTFIDIFYVLLCPVTVDIGKNYRFGKREHSTQHNKQYDNSGN
jgi:hypothetical protein